jgi:hypothetical protein
LKIKDLKEKAEPLVQELLTKYPEYNKLFMLFNEPDAHYGRLGNTEAADEKKKQKRNAKVKIHHFTMESLLKTPAVVETFYNLVKQVKPDLTEEDYDMAIEHWKGKKRLETKADRGGKKMFHWVK